MIYCPTDPNIPTELRNNPRGNGIPLGRRPWLCGQLTGLKSRAGGCGQSLSAEAPGITCASRERASHAHEGVSE